MRPLLRHPHFFRLFHFSPPPRLPSLTTPASPPPPRRRALVDLGLLAAGVSSLGALTLWLRSVHHDRLHDPLPADGSQFEITLASHTGSPGAKKILTMLSPEQVDCLLKKYEASFVLDRVGNPVSRYDTNHVASNSPIEDDSICSILSRERSGAASGSSPGDMLFFGVFDGHSGWQTSKLLVQHLVPAVRRELSAVSRGEPQYVAAYLAKEIVNSSSGPDPPGLTLQSLEPQNGLMDRIWRFVTRNQGRKQLIINLLNEDDDVIRLAIQNAFVKLDDELTSRPLKMLAMHDAQLNSGQQALSRSYGSELTPQQTASLQALLPALSGSCALLAYLDTARSKVHVACTGDSRAVMGVWDPKANWGRGKWRAKLLSEDQEGTNPNEVKRIQSEHPAAEKDNVVRRGRVLGGLQPTRAFGDARYKWPVGISERLYDAFHPAGSVKRDPPGYLTPPYVTAKPEVTSTPLPDMKDTDQPAFIVLATDGLWDRLDTAEVVGLVGTWIEESSQPHALSYPDEKVLDRDHVAGTSRVEVIQQAGLATPTAHDPLSSSGERKTFVFSDSNVATHLIRNALGGASHEKVGALLSIPAPHSRRYRDDITVTVIFIDPQKADNEKGDGQAGGVVQVKPGQFSTAKL